MLEIALGFLVILFLCPPLGLATGTIVAYLLLLRCDRQEQEQIHLTSIMALLLAAAAVWKFF